MRQFLIALTLALLSQPLVAGTYYSRICGPFSEIAKIAGPMAETKDQAFSRRRLSKRAKLLIASHSLEKTEYEQRSVRKSIENYGLVFSSPFSLKRVDAGEPVETLCIVAATGGLSYQYVEKEDNAHCLEQALEIRTTLQLPLKK